MPSSSDSTSQPIGVLPVFPSFHYPPIGRSFTPVLAKFYEDVNKSEKKFEVVFASCDKTDKEFAEYIAIMPWKAYPFKDPKIDELSGKYAVDGIPRLIILKPDGSVLVSNARGDVQSNGPAAFDEWMKKVK